VRRPVVLVHHGVGLVSDGQDPDRLVVSPAHLESQLRLLLRLGYRFVTAAEALERFPGGRLPRGIAMVTFDDGWRDAVTVVAPLLERLGVRASFYVCPGMWGGQHASVTGGAGALLTRDEARELHERGMEVASHTLSHPDLRRLDDTALAAELGDSKAAIEELTGARCRTFAYPFGLFDARVRTAVGAAGYELALAWQLRRGYDPLAVGRLPGPPRQGAWWLALKLLGVRIPERLSRRWR
jgi:peptidoglycan/xylan/chitin deacetylase (PgdA/CDA1 family)